MATRGFSFKGLVDYVLALKDSVLANTAKIDTSVAEINTKIDGLTAADVGIRTHVVDSGTSGSGNYGYWWRKWNDGFVEQGGRASTSTFERDIHGACFYWPPVPLVTSKPYTILSVGSNGTSTYCWDGGGDGGAARLRGKWYFRDGASAPSSYNDIVNWSASGYYQ